MTDATTALAAAQAAAASASVAATSAEYAAGAIAQVATAGSALSKKLVGAGVSLTAYGLDDSTTDIATVIAAAIADGKRHLVVPYRAAPWPSLTTITLIDTWLEFEPGARISFNHHAAGAALLRSRLSRASFTSIYNGPASADDATSLNYTFPAREVTLVEDSVIDGGYYHENACNGIHFTGAHNRINCALTFKHIRHQRGWAAAIHTAGAACFDNRITGAVHIDGADRGIENEDGAHDIQYLGGGYLKNVYPIGYTGQGSAASYENYTFVMDLGHSHENEGAVWGVVYGGTWTVENSGCAVTATRSTGTNDSDMPRDSRVDEVRVIGRAISTGSRDIDLQGHNLTIGRAIFEEGAGIAGGTFRIRSFPTSTNARVDRVVAKTDSARPVLTDDGTGLVVNGQKLPLPSTNRTNTFLSLPNRPVTTSNGLGNGTIRTAVMYIPTRVTIDQLGTEITVAGNAGAVMRVGIWDDVKGLPNSVLADVSVAADAVATPMVALGAPLTLEPGWYHVGGVLQNGATTQPTVRCCVNQTPDDGFLVFTNTTSSVSPMGYSRGGYATGALPAWGTGVAISTTNLVPRLWARVTAAL